MVVDFEVASDFHCTRRADKSSPQIFLGASWRARALKDSDCTAMPIFPHHTMLQPTLNDFRCGESAVTEGEEKGPGTDPLVGSLNQ